MSGLKVGLQSIFAWRAVQTISTSSSVPSHSHPFCAISFPRSDEPDRSEGPLGTLRTINISSANQPGVATTVLHHCVSLSPFAGCLPPHNFSSSKLVGITATELCVMVSVLQCSNQSQLWVLSLASQLCKGRAQLPPPPPPAPSPSLPPPWVFFSEHVRPARVNLPVGWFSWLLGLPGTFAFC